MSCQIEPLLMTILHSHHRRPPPTILFLIKLG